MRLVLIADTHRFEDDLRDVPSGDVLIHAGDACRRGTLQELAGASAWLGAFPHRHKLFVAGNHDRALQDHPAEARALLLRDGLSYLEDNGVELEGVRFWGSPWTPAFHDWAFMRERGAPLRERWALIPEGLHVLVTHGPPRGYGDATTDGRGQGCEDLLRRVHEARPLLHVYGHIHEGRGAWRAGTTTFVNATTWECELPPAVIDLDAATGQVDVVAI